MVNRWSRVVVALLVLGVSSVASAAIQIVSGTALPPVHVGSMATSTVTLVTTTSDQAYTSVAITPIGASTAAECGQVTIASGSSGVVTAAGGGTVQLKFQPGVHSTFSCTLTFFNGASSVGSGQIMGAGLAPQIGVSASSINFGSVRQSNLASTATATKSLVITNTGNTDLQVDSYELSGGDYAFTTPPPTTPLTLTVGANVTLNFTFDPSAAGTVTGAVIVHGSDPANGMPWVSPTVNFTGVGTNAKAVLGTSLLDFGIIPDGTSSSRSVSVSNAGAAPIGPLAVTAVSISSTSPWFTFANTGACGSASGGTSCSPNLSLTSTPGSIDILCTPSPATTNATNTAIVTFTTDGDPGSATSMMLSCTGGRSDITVSTAALAFGDQRLGAASPPQAVTISNLGNTALTYAITKSGPMASDFAVTGCPVSGSVVAGAMVTCNVTFTPAGSGARSAALTITSNDPDPGDGSKTVTLSGNGVSPQISAPALLDFGGVDLGASSGTTTLTITNTGTQALSIASAALTLGAAAYSLMSGTTGAQTVAAGATATWQLTCTPTAQGSNAGSFRILSDSLTGATTDVPLKCTGQQGLITANPGSINFGPVPAGTLQQVSLTIKNTGNLPITGLTGVITDTTLGYSIDASTPVPTSLAAGASSTIKVDFLPADANAGGPTTLTLAGTWTGNTAHPTQAIVPLDGDGQSTDLDVNPGTVAFGSFRWDTPTSVKLCLVNAAQAATKIDLITITLDAPAVAGEVTVTGIKLQSTCGTGGTAQPLPYTLASGAALEVTLTANPQARIGVMNGDIAITTELATNPIRHVPFTGTRTSGVLTLSTMALDFGAVDVDTGPKTDTITITNSGGAPIDLSSFTKTTNDPTLTITLPANTTLAPGATAMIGVSYDPTAVAALTNQSASFSATHLEASAPSGSVVVAIPITGHGADRTFVMTPASGTLTFDDTFRHPATPPTKTVTVSNQGEATLHVTATMVTGEAFALDGAGTVDIPGGGTHDFAVRFAPTMVGTFDGTIAFASDDDASTMAQLALRGVAIARGVAATTSVDAGYVGVGGTTTARAALSISNMDATHPFAIHSLASSDAAFAIVGDLATPLAAGETRTFDVTFTPTEDGDLEASALLLLDSDPEPQATITLRGHALTIDAHGGGCTIGGDATTWAPALASLGLLLRRRRRRRRVEIFAPLLVVCLVARSATADELALGTFLPAPSSDADPIGFQVASPVVGRAGDLATSAVASYATNLVEIDGTSAGTHVIMDRPVAARAGFVIGAAFALRDTLEVGLTVPLYAQRGTSDNAMLPSSDAGGVALGDVGAHVKLALADTDTLGFALAAHVYAPTATPDQYVGGGLPSASALAIVRVRPTRALALTANLGGVARAPATTIGVAPLHQTSAGLWALGAALAVHPRFALVGEAFGELLDSSPAEALAGALVRPTDTLSFGFAAGAGIHRGLGAPDLRVVAGLTYTPMRGWRKR